MGMKRKIISIVFIMFFAICLFAQEAESQTETNVVEQQESEKPVLEQAAELKIIQHGKSPIQIERYGIVLDYGLGQEYWKADTRFAFAFKDFVLNLSGAYFPFLVGNWKIGFELTYVLDIYYYYGLCITNNILPGMCFDWNPASWYKMNLHVDYFLKLRSLFSIEGTPCLYNSSFAFSWKNMFYPSPAFCLYLELASVDDFHYIILFAPLFTIGFDYAIKNGWSLCVEVVSEYQDFFTISAHYVDTLVNMSLRYKW